MSDSGKKLRINRIFRAPSRRALIVAFDHAIFFGPIAGTTDPHMKIRQFAMHGADAILMNVGILRKCIDSLLQPTAPAVILRLDWTTAWDAAGGTKKAISKLMASPEQALNHGADAVIAYLFVGTGDTDFEANEVETTARLARECEQLGIPLIVETLARGPDVHNPESLDWMKLHARMAVELGADLIKTDYAGSAESMRTIIEMTPLPIFVLGGSRKDSDDTALDVVRGAVQAGAAGVFFGRNIFQAENIPEFLNRARSVLDGDAKPGKRT